tara:strand:+ start:6666 stop:7265 length:600 start_codon:yes stop_codon:yes gene_type:complete
MNENYHTALNDKNHHELVVHGTEYYENNFCKIFQYDFIPSKTLRKEYDECDFLYVEVPYPQGIKIFDERANIKQTRSLDDFASALNEIINIGKPIGITTSKFLHKKLPQPIAKYDMKIHIGNVTFAIYNTNPNMQFKTSSELMQYVANHYQCLGDFCCGYGFPLLQFLDYGGKKIIASDYNSKCITVLKQKMKVYEKNI